MYVWLTASSLLKRRKQPLPGTFLLESWRMSPTQRTRRSWMRLESHRGEMRVGQNNRDRESCVKIMIDLRSFLRAFLLNLTFPEHVAQSNTNKGVLFFSLYFNCISQSSPTDWVCLNVMDEIYVWESEKHMQCLWIDRLISRVSHSAYQ